MQNNVKNIFTGKSLFSPFFSNLDGFFPFFLFRYFFFFFLVFTQKSQFVFKVEGGR